MDCKTNQPETAGPSLLALIDEQGGDIGATLLRLAHRAAAAHRFEHATGATAVGAEPAAYTALPSRSTTIQSSGAGGQP